MYNRFKNATTIQISKKNHEYLLKIGTKGQTFDDIISELLKEQEQEQEEREDKNGGGAK